MTKLVALAALTFVLVAGLAPVAASSQPYDRFGSTLEYNPARGSPGPGNGPEWKGYPSDHNTVWRNGRYRGNDPDENIRRQLMRDK